MVIFCGFVLLPTVLLIEPLAMSLVIVGTRTGRAHGFLPNRSVFSIPDIDGQGNGELITARNNLTEPVEMTFICDSTTFSLAATLQQEPAVDVG